VVRGDVSERHRPIVAGFHATRPMVDAVASTVAAFRADPASVGDVSRELLGVAHAVEVDGLDVADAYLRVARIVADTGIADGAFYRDVLGRLYGRPEATTP
jgi:hypothetical protein